MGLNALKINSCVPILVMCWFEEKIDARADNPQKIERLREKRLFADKQESTALGVGLSVITLRRMRGYR